MPTEYEAIRDKLYTVISGVPNIGIVHKQKRYKKNNAELKDSFVSTVSGSDMLLGWEITRAGMTPGTGAFGRMRHRAEIFEVDGWMALVDADNTEQVFQVKVSAVVDALDAINWDDPDMGSINVFASGPCAITVVEEAMFAGVLCHHATLRLPVQVDKAV